MWSILVACAVVAAQPAESSVDADQFLRLMGGALSEIESVHFAFEGQKRFTGPSSLTDDPKHHEMSFQGTYAFRSDGSTLLDSYIHGLSADRPLVHETLAMMKGRLESVTLLPDLKPSAKVMVENGGPGSLRKSGSPEFILYLWYFKTLRNLNDRGYEFQGWEDVDGHRCLKVKIGGRPHVAKDDSNNPRRNVPTTESRYWIDLDRGGHPLKVEHYSGERLTSRIDKIRLEQIPATDRKTVWMPVYGEIGTFRWMRDQYYDSPVLVEICTVRPSSARVNERIPDAIFSVVGGRYAFEDGQLRRARQEFEKIKRTPLPRIDPEGSEQELTASSAAREEIFWTPVKQLSFGTLGIIVLVAALIVRRRA